MTIIWEKCFICACLWAFALSIFFSIKPFKDCSLASIQTVFSAIIFFPFFFVSLPLICEVIPRFIFIFLDYGHGWQKHHMKHPYTNLLVIQSTTSLYFMTCECYLSYPFLNLFLFFYPFYLIFCLLCPIPITTFYLFYPSYLFYLFYHSCPFYLFYPFFPSYL